MKYKNVMDRRTFLKGAGTIAIGLPFLDTMMARSAFAALPNPPDRVLTVFFGLGVPKEYTVNGFVDSLEPLSPFADRLNLYRNIDLRQESNGPENNHFDGSGGVFVGELQTNNSTAGGPSIDQVIKNQLHPNGAPTALQTLLMGSFFRRTVDGGNSPTRYVHSWRQDGSAVDNPIEDPSALFERVFGDIPGGTGLPGDEKARRYRLSILDSVVDQYQFIQSDASPFGARAKAKIADHLDRIFELEQSIINAEIERSAACMPDTAPTDPALLQGQPKDPGGSGVDLTVDNWQRYWRMLVDTYVLGVRCDIVRFGNVMFQSGGERVRLSGDYQYNGQSFFNFNDQDTAHEYWHRYVAGRQGDQNEVLQGAHIHYMMNEIAYYFEQLDDQEFLEENGQSIFDNSLIMMGTELGNGAAHDLVNVFHATNGANGRLQTGMVVEDNMSGVDLYNTVLKGCGMENVTMGNQGAFNGYNDNLLDVPYLGS